MPLTTETGVPAAARTMSSARAVNILLFGGALIFGTGFYFRHMSTRPGTVNQAPLGSRDYQTDGGVPDEAVEQGDPRLINVQQGGRRDKAVEALMEPAVQKKK